MSSAFSGSAKPSSSGSASELDSSLSASSSGIVSSSGSGNDGSIGGSSSSGSSSSGFCAWDITTLTYFADNEMAFNIQNTGTVDLIVTAITTAIAATIGPYTFPFTIPPGGLIGIGVVSDSDLRLTAFTVFTSCGDQTEYFPAS